MAKKRTDDIYGIVDKEVVLPVTCGRCMFFKNYATYDKPCSELGRLESSTTCPRGAPDPRRLDAFGDEHMKILLKAIGQTKMKSGLLDLAWRIVKEASSRKFSDLRTGDTVYLRIGADYLNNYTQAIVLGSVRESVGTERVQQEATKRELQIDKEKKQSRFATIDGRKVRLKAQRVLQEYVLIRGKKGYNGKVQRNSLITAAEWKKKKELLIAAKKINDPKSPLAKIPTNKLAIYEPPLTSGKNKGKVAKDKTPKRIGKGPQVVIVRGGSSAHV